MSEMLVSPLAWRIGNSNRDLVVGHDQVRMNNEWQFEITNAIWDRRDCVLQMIILLMEGINGDIIRPNVSRSNSDQKDSIKYFLILIFAEVLVPNSC